MPALSPAVLDLPLAPAQNGAAAVHHHSGGVNEESDFSRYRRDRRDRRCFSAGCIRQPLVEWLSLGANVEPVHNQARRQRQRALGRDAGDRIVGLVEVDGDGHDHRRRQREAKKLPADRRTRRSV